MENLIISLVFDLLTLVTDTYKIYIKNGRLMALIAMLIVSLHTMLFLFNFFSIKPMINDLIIKESFLLLSTPGTPEFTGIIFGIQEEIKLFVGVESVFLFINSIVSFFFAISTTHASALIHVGKAISIKDLVLKTMRSLQRPFLTCFYITLLGLGYILLSLLTLLPIGLSLGNQVISILLTISAMIFYTYLSVVWSLSLVVSTLEEKSGIEALGKAAKIVKGMKFLGFILNLLIIIISLALFRCLGVIVFLKSQAITIVVSLVVLNLVWMVRMFGDTAFTVLYFQCKKSQGEEVELLQAGMEYTKISSTAPLISENIP